MTPRHVLSYIFLFLSLTLVNPGRSHGSPQGDPGRVTFAQFIERIEERTGFSIAYATNDIAVKSVNMPDISGLTAEQALWKVLDRREYNLQISGQHIIIKKNHGQGQPASTHANTEPRQQATDKIPPPKESVFSGETRLIIIRSKPVRNNQNQAGQTAQKSVRAPQDRRSESENYRRLEIENGLVALQPEDNSAKPVAKRHIPFRADLLETDVYKREDVPEKLSRKEKKRNRKFKSGGN